MTFLLWQNHRFIYRQWLLTYSSKHGKYCRTILCFRSLYFHDFGFCRRAEHVRSHDNLHDNFSSSIARRSLCRIHLHSLVNLPHTQIYVSFATNLGYHAPLQISKYLPLDVKHFQILPASSIAHTRLMTCHDFIHLIRPSRLRQQALSCHSNREQQTHACSLALDPTALWSQHGRLIVFERGRRLDYWRGGAQHSPYKSKLSV